MRVKRGTVRLGADPTLRDELHDGDPAGWAEACGCGEIASLLPRQR